MSAYPGRTTRIAALRAIPVFDNDITQIEERGDTDLKKYAPGLHPGARWRRADFQVHTPRDPNWSGKHLPGGTPAEEGTRKSWATDVVEACRSAGVTAISLTDHHDMAMVPYLRRALVELNAEDEIWLLPGMEVTCEDACQALLLFDASSDETHWDRLFGGGLKTIAKPASDTATAPQALACGRQIEEFIEQVAEDPILNDLCIVLPHAGNDGAHKSVLRDGFHIRFRELRCDGFYSDKEFEKIKPKTRNIVFGEYADWGTRRRGLVPTSDSRRLSDIGSAPCWIRLGEPTAEAIRQSLLVDEARISYTEPEVPSQRIVEVAVWSTLTGDELRISVNDGLTALIGGRGAGKSALLEYLRFGLGRSSLDIDSRDSESTRAQRLLEDTLVDGKVVVRIERNGVIEAWTRRLGDRDSIEIEHEDGSSETIPIETAKERFRARAFEQKELSTILDSKQSAVEQITAIAAAELRDRRKDAESRISRAQRGIRGAFQRLVERWRLESTERSQNARIGDLQRRINALRAQLEGEGLSAEDRATINAAPHYARARSYVDEIGEDINGAIDTVSRLRGELLPDSSLPELGDSEDFVSVRNLATSIAGARVSIEQGFEAIARALNDLVAKHSETSAEFEDKESAYSERSSEASQRASAHSQLVDDLGGLQEELGNAETAHRRTQRDLAEYSDAESALEEAQGELDLAREERREVLEAARDATTQVSEGLLRAEVENEDIPAARVSALSEIGEGCRIHELNDKAACRVSELAPDPQSGWKALSTIVVALYRRRIEAGESDQLSPDQVKEVVGDALFRDLTPRQHQEIGSRLSEERVIAMLTAIPNEYIAFDYRDRDGFIKFENASQGQQAAALLQLLLGQEAGTLIIDQPEEDLDSGVIMDIVSLLRKTKQTRQLIFATHNPNFVVNGDADKVVALKPGSRSVDEAELTSGSPRIRLLVDGALETKGVADAVTTTMEGGKKAFELRRRKYGFHDPH